MFMQLGNLSFHFYSFYIIVLIVESRFVFCQSEGVFLCSIVEEHNQYRNLVVRLDKLNPLKNTLITSPKAVEILCAYEFYQNELGPKLLCVYKNGRIEEWIAVSAYPFSECSASKKNSKKSWFFSMIF